MKNKIGLMVLILAVVLAGGAIVYKLDEISKLMNKPAKSDSPADAVATLPGASLAYIEGAVEYKKPGGQWLRAEAGTDLGEGDSIEVVGAGKAIVNLDDGSAIRLDGDSGVTLENLDPKNIIIKNDKGQSYFRVVKAERTFEVKTDEVVYQSVGTAYSAINKEKEKGLKVYQSQAKVKKDSQEIAVSEGEKYFIKNETAPDKENKVEKMTAEEIKKDEFAMWNKEKDSATEEYKNELGVLKEEPAAPEPETSDAEINGRIDLTAKTVETGVKLTWVVGGINLAEGYKVLKSLEPNPVYPGSNYQYLSSEAARSFLWNVTDGKTYYFRVCQYLGGKCGVYSNQVKVAAPLKITDASGAVTSIALTAGSAGQVAWKASGYSEQGFKVVWSKNASPTYPGREGDQYQYFSDPAKTAAVLTAFAGSGAYYVRVCEYLGGKCGVYSNQVTAELE